MNKHEFWKTLKNPVKSKEAIRRAAVLRQLMPGLKEIFGEEYREEDFE